MHLKKEVWKRVAPQHRISKDPAKPTMPELLAGLDRTLAELGNSEAQLRLVSYSYKPRLAGPDEPFDSGLGYCLCGGKIEKKDAHWAMCPKCGDDTFPITAEAAVYYVPEDEP